MSYAGADWSSTAAVASAIIAAIAALISLWQANEFRKQVRDDRRFRQVEAAIAYSPYLSEGYQTAARLMTAKFGPLTRGKKGSLNSFDDAFSDRELHAHWVSMLNHWGRLSTAYYAGILDEDTARNIHHYGFISFMSFFEPYFDAHMSKEHYKNTIRLFEDWS